MAVAAVLKMPTPEGDQKNIHSFFQVPQRPSIIPAANVQKEHKHDVVEETLPNSSGPTDISFLTDVLLPEPPEAIRSLDISRLEAAELNCSRRKRRKTASPQSAEDDCKDAIKRSNVKIAFVGFENNEPTSVTDSSPADFSKNPKLPAYSISNGPKSEINNQSSTGKSVTPASSSPKATKVLKLNPRTGTIGSPPAKKPSSEAVKPSRTTRRRTPRSLLVKLEYGVDSESRVRLGSKIDLILASPSEMIARATLTKHFTQAITTASKPKITHPFFLGKIVPGPESEIELRADTVIALPDQSKRNGPLSKPSFASPAAINRLRAAGGGSAISSHAFGKSNKVLRFPGAIEPAWPPRNMMHIRGNDPVGNVCDVKPQAGLPKRSRKSKYIATDTSPGDDVLGSVAKRLNIASIVEALKNYDSNAFPLPDGGIRLPQKHLESGVKLQKRMKSRLKTHVGVAAVSDDFSEDELQSSRKLGQKSHAAIINMFRSISTSLSAFDRSEYETLSWAQKYAPSSAAGVLQTGKDAFILKEWLQSLTVKAVESKTSDDTSARLLPKQNEHRPRKKRKSKLDDFIVSSDEGEDALTEVSDLEDDLPPSSQDMQRTVVRATHRSKKTEKFKNAVVISGPSGCGKTAMVYAVAKELGFDVFEINAGSRRSGKDIMDRVGDMTRNHLVQGSRGREQQGAISDDVTDSVTTVAEIESGRQGTVESFFQPKKVLSLVQKESKPQPKVSKIKSSPKQQRQSLILFEEADLLYEEDKQFWPTVFTLIAQSKRPVIITCNNEALIPLQALSVHAIIRLSPPPVDVAVDYSLLVAANQGHILDRNAVSALYTSRGFDLRACLTELEAWCQIGVGDRRGGLEWFVSRWPTGCDKDEHGDIIRVVSEGTYCKGMAWLGQSDEENVHENDTNESLLQHAWSNWQIHPAELDSVDTKHSLDETHLNTTSLVQFCEMSELMSVADLCSSSILSSEAATTLNLDATLPDVPDRCRLDYVVGYELLQAGDGLVFESVARDIALSLMSAVTKLSMQDSISLQECIADRIEHKTAPKSDNLTREDFGAAFDPIACSDISCNLPTAIELSVFDRTLRIISLEVAPYVRSIVTFENNLQRERAKLSNLLSEGGRPGKRPRTTRAAMSALEGGNRKETRKERWFEGALNTTLVLRTGVSFKLHDKDCLQPCSEDGNLWSKRINR